VQFQREPAAIPLHDLSIATATSNNQCPTNISNDNAENKYDNDNDNNFQVQVQVKNKLCAIATTSDITTARSITLSVKQYYDRCTVNNSEHKEEVKQKFSASA